MNAITDVRAREILDSRGNPTVYAEVRLYDGSVGAAGVPSGASTGSREAFELRDGDPGRFGGKGVLKAVGNVNDKIRRAILGRDVGDQAGLDRVLIDLDGTPEKKNLGANAILAVSLAAVQASAASRSVPLFHRFAELAGIENPTTMPVPMFNILNGGVHAHGSTDFQEFMVVPVGMPDFPSALRAGAEIYGRLRDRLLADGQATTVGDEGGFAPAGFTTRQALDTLVAAISETPYSLGDEVGIAIDAAASEFFDPNNGTYNLKRENRRLSSLEMIDLYEALVSEYPIMSIEDGLAEADWDGWAALTERLGARVQILGDDLFVTQDPYVQRGIDAKSANAVLVKLNQVGTVTETLATIALARDAGWGTVISHRSGETEDTAIADLAVGTGAGQIKAGAPARSERVAKYNRLLRIGDELGAAATYAGRTVYGSLRH